MSLTNSEVARRSNVTPNAVTYWQDTGKLPYSQMWTRTGGLRRMVDEADFEKFDAARKEWLKKFVASNDGGRF